MAALAALLVAAFPLAHGARGATDSTAVETTSVFLSWSKPFEHPDAMAQLITACKDSLEVDTLYLSVRPARSYLSIVSMEAVLLFHPMPGDTLQPYWFFKSGWPNEHSLFVDFDFIRECSTPWVERVRGAVAYDHRSGRGRLDLSLKAAPEVGRGITAGNTYCLARIMFTHRRTQLSGCQQPVCVEVAGVRLQPRWGPGLEITQGERFVTWNGKDAEVCTPHRGTTAVRAWRPQVPIGDTPATFNPPPMPRDSLLRRD